MNSQNKVQDTSTPKRRRLGNTKIVRSNNLTDNNNSISNYSPIASKVLHDEMDNVDRCDSPHLPCNQVEFLCDSVNNSTASDIPCSPGVLRTSINQWESLDVSTSKLDKYCYKSQKNRVLLEEIEDISDDMFHSKLEQSMHNYEEKIFKDKIEESFDVINESIADLHEVMKSKSSLFETKDSFLLDIKESGIVKETQLYDNEYKKTREQINTSNSFYGLPLITKGLFKSYRNIEKFYGM